MLKTLGKHMSAAGFSLEGLNFFTENLFTDFGEGEKKVISAQVL